jgi:dethiobiotin synthetase
VKAVFVTGTDTEIGKTLVAGLLARYLCDKGYRAITQKWIQTGTGSFPTDIAVHLKLMGRKVDDVEEHLPAMAPYEFQLAASPHLAAGVEKKKISAARIKRSFQTLSKKYDFVIVEGVGGVLVPFNRKKLVIDIARELALPVVIVVQNKLGAINHALLTIEALRARNMKILGLVFNAWNEKEDRIILEDNPKIIKALTGEKILGQLPWSEEPDLLRKAFFPVGDKIIAELVRRPQDG